MAGIRSAAQRAAQLKAAKVSAAKRKRRGLNSLEKKDIGNATVLNGTTRVSASRTKGAVLGSDKARSAKKRQSALLPKARWIRNGKENMTDFGSKDRSSISVRYARSGNAKDAAAIKSAKNKIAGKKLKTRSENYL